MSETQLRPIPSKPPRMPAEVAPPPAPAPRGKITVSADELTSSRVEERLKQQEAVSAAQTQYQRQTPSALDVARRSRESSSLFSSTVFNMALFGLLGGLLAWGCGELRYRLVHDDFKNYQELRQQYAQYMGGSAGIDSLEIFLQEANKNPYFKVYADTSLSPQEQQKRIDELKAYDKLKIFIADMLYYGACGMFLAMALAMAEPMSSRNYREAITNGAAGAAVGLAGGIIVSLFISRLYQAIITNGDGSLSQGILADMLRWGVLGLFLTAAPGLILRNRRKLLVGLAGGLIGGIVGGALGLPLTKLNNGWFLQDSSIGRFVALVGIGVVAGAATGLIENAAKSGWLKVTSGLIAGKQFILYRNPTFIGSSPQCQIYLFKDAQIGRRHAAIHLQPNAYFIEDLGTGSGTRVNDQPIARVRLRHGDRVQVGSTTFAFREKRKTA